MSKYPPEMAAYGDEFLRSKLQIATRKVSHCPCSYSTFSGFTQAQRDIMSNHCGEWMRPLACNIGEGDIRQATTQAFRMVFFWVLGEPYVEVETQPGVSRQKMVAHGWEHRYAGVYRRHFPISWAAIQMSLV